MFYSSIFFEMILFPSQRDRNDGNGEGRETRERVTNAWKKGENRMEGIKEEEADREGGRG